MKTIKEKNKLALVFIKEGREDLANHLLTEIHEDEEVLGVIYVRLKQNDRAFRANSIGVQQYNWTKNELEELKKRIEGEKQ